MLIALYENETPFRGEIVDLADAKSGAALLELWPVGKIPALRDEARDRTIPETTIILEYLGRHYAGPVPLLPERQPDRLDARLWDRFFDLYVQAPMRRIVTDRLRPEGEQDRRGVAEARATLATACDMIERRMAERTWVVGSGAAGEGFSLADCAAAPALFYSGIVEPFTMARPHVAAYFERLVARPSFSRVLDEARPYFRFFPYRDAVPARFLSGA